MAHFWQKLRESNVLNKEVTKELISRKNVLVIENFAKFYTVGQFLPRFISKSLVKLTNLVRVSSVDVLKLLNWKDSKN